MAQLCNYKLGHFHIVSHTVSVSNKIFFLRNNYYYTLTSHFFKGMPDILEHHTDAADLPAAHR